MVTAAVSEVQKGLVLGTASIRPAVTVPSVPLAVNLTVISTSELGVYWTAPTQTGGAAVSKYLVEWDVGVDSGSALSRSAATLQGTYAQAMAFTQVVAAPTTQYQIVGLDEGTAYHVRVSAYNAAGYGPPRRTTPIFAKPAAQVPYKPTHVSARLSSSGAYVNPIQGGVTGAVDPRSPGQIPDQLDLSWVQPVVDSSTQLFKATDGGATILGYTVQWDTDPAFGSEAAGASGQISLTSSVAGTYDIRAVQTDGSALPCTMSNCSFALGAEVQVLRVYGGGTDPLTAGSYTLQFADTGLTTECIAYDIEPWPGVGRSIVSRETRTTSPTATPVPSMAASTSRGDASQAISLDGNPANLKTSLPLRPMHDSSWTSFAWPLVRGSSPSGDSR